MATHTSLWPVTTTITTPKPSPTSPTSTASKLGDCCSQKANLTTPYGLQESLTRILLPTTFHSVIDLPVNDSDQHPNPFHTAIDPANGDAFSTHSTPWCNCNNEDFDYSSELNAIAEACEHMQQWWPTATTMVPPTIQPTTMTPTQQSPMPLMQWCRCDDEDLDFSLAINDLVEACDHMQQRWLMIMTMTAPHHPSTKPTPKWQNNDSDLDTLAYLAEFIHSDMDEQLDDPPPTPNIHWLPMSYHDTHVLQTNDMAKLIAMIGNLNEKIELLTTAITCPPKSPLDSTMNAHMIPVPQLLLSCTLLSPQQHTVLRLFKPQDTFETLCDSIIRIQLAPVSHLGPYKNVIPAKPPLHHGCNPLIMIQTKDSMRPLNWIEFL